MEAKCQTFKIHLYTPPEEKHSLPEEAGETDLLVKFLEAGLDMLHIRKPSMTLGATEQFLTAIPSKYHDRIVLHDHPSLAVKYGCGFQVNSRNPVVGGMVRRLSRGCHGVDELKEVEASDFITLSPVFDSISKEGYKSGVDLKNLRGSDLSKVIALGGITLESIDLIKKTGFGGAAFLGEVWNRPDGISRFYKFLHLRNFSLQFITDGLDAATTIAQARHHLEAGGKWVQVRMKNAGMEEIKEVLKVLMPQCREKGATLIVDDHYELAEYCNGVHLGQNDEKVEMVRGLIGKEKIIGLTVNNSTHIENSLRALPDYYGVGPYRFTKTKKNLAPVLGLDGYRRLAPLMKRKFVAIGGIGISDIPEILRAGASGIAVSSLITRADDPVKMTRQLIDIILKKK